MPRNIGLSAVSKSFFSITTYPDGKSLLEDCEDPGLLFDLLFMDINMPGMNGIATAGKIRAHLLDVKIIFISSSNEHYPEPVYAQGRCWLIRALLIRALIQYRMRKGYEAWQVEHPGQNLAVGWANQKPKSLIYKMFFDYGRGIYFLWETNGSFTLSYASQEGFDKTTSYLNLMGLGLQDLLKKA